MHVCLLYCMRVRLRKRYTRASHAKNATTHMHKAVAGRVEAKVTFLSKAIRLSKYSAVTVLPDMSCWNSRSVPSQILQLDVVIDINKT